jgi:hypothetical protein
MFGGALLSQWLKPFDTETDAASPGNTSQAVQGLSGCPWRQRQVDEIPDRYDPGIAELPQPEQVLVLAHDEVRFRGRSAFEDAVVVGMTFSVSVGET